jgi:hypothetical protein
MGEVYRARDPRLGRDVAIKVVLAAFAAILQSSAEALLEIHRRNPARAIELLSVATPYELTYGSGLLPVYVRGLAYLSLKNGPAAAAEFQKVLDNRGAAAKSIFYRVPVCNRRARSRSPVTLRGAASLTRHF